MARSAKLTFMTGDKTDKATLEKLESALNNHRIDQFEILLYKKNGKSFNKVFTFVFWNANHFTIKESFRLPKFMNSKLVLCFYNIRKINFKVN